MSAAPAAPLVEERGAEATDDLVYIGAGPLLAVVLGFSLVPLREATNSANLSFPFVIVTVVIAAFGGRSAGVATALASALSMDFFLTRPYLSLRIAENHDLIAFGGLALCGLVAASLGSGHRIASLQERNAHARLVEGCLAELEGAGPLESVLAQLLGQTCQVLAVKALVVRDGSGRVVAAAPHRAGLEAVPAEILEPDTLIKRGTERERLRGSPPLPPAGARIAIVNHQRQEGWLDLWGDGAPATAASRRTLTAVARVAGVLLARDGRR
jgi:K+-sensing histidine kinase KdpD